MEPAPPSGGRPVRHSAKVFLRGETGCYLLLRRSSSCRNNAGKWDLPGGKADPEESLDAALLREIGEETGLQAVLESLLGHVEVELGDRALSYRICEARVTGGVLRLSGEHDSHAWVRAGELCGYDLVPHFIPFAQSIAAGKPLESSRRPPISNNL